RIALVILEQDGAFLAAFDLEADDGVELVGGGDCDLDRFRIDGDVQRRSEWAVADGGDEALCPQPPRRTLARLVALLRLQRRCLVRHFRLLQPGTTAAAGAPQAWVWWAPG